MTKRHVLAALAVLSLVSIPVLAAQSGDTYRTRLSVVPLDVAMQANVAGQGSVTATLAGNKLTVNGTAEGLRSPATVAHIHRGMPGIPGPSILDLTVSKTTTPTISGTVDLTPQMVEDLKNGQLYVQLNSERAPDGNLRGWLTHAN
ncbi:MAG TPA: CHRD domain-containing protein [Micropepsaceae bacterium]|nr:CHRD domain-containing protein [Micropepsaceae bacterium]